MTCSHRIEIAAGVKVPGVTAQGLPITVLPGQHLLHELPCKLLSAMPLFRIVGAESCGRDVRVDLETVAPYVAAAWQVSQAA